MLTRCAVSSVHTERRRMKASIGAGIAALVAVAVAVAGCGSRPATPTQEEPTALSVVAVDRTGVAAAETWADEVAVQVSSEAERAMGDGFDRIEIIGIGSTTNDTVRWATVDLTRIEGNTRAKRAAERERLIAAAGAAGHDLAAAPVTTYGTDVVAAISEANALCRNPGVGPCSMLLISDLEDQRVTGATSAAAAVEVLTPLMPDLGGVSVRVSGLGASGADSTVVTQVEQAWQTLLESAGAVDVRIARSL